MTEAKKYWYPVVVSKEDIRKERNKARELKNSSWWKQKLSEGKCYYCGDVFEQDKLTMDHIVALARGGKSTKRNVVVSCLDCNSKKGLSTPVDMLIEKIRPEKGKEEDDDDGNEGQA
jgi:5-methylcytosine-specific restriction enzyme A